MDPLAIPIFAIMIPLAAVVLSLAIAMIFVLTAHRRKLRELEHRHQERMVALDKGVEIPGDPMPQPASAPRSTLLRGLVWLGVGLALVLGRLTGGDSDLATLGWIPAAVGCAYLIYYFVEGRKRADGSKAERGGAETSNGGAP